MSIKREDVGSTATVCASALAIIEIDDADADAEGLVPSAKSALPAFLASNTRSRSTDVI